MEQLARLVPHRPKGRLQAARHFGQHRQPKGIGKGQYQRQLAGTVAENRKNMFIALKGKVDQPVIKGLAKGAYQGIEHQRGRQIQPTPQLLRFQAESTKLPQDAEQPKVFSQRQPDQRVESAFEAVAEIDGQERRGKLHAESKKAKPENRRRAVQQQVDMLNQICRRIQPKEKHKKPVMRKAGLPGQSWQQDALTPP